MSLTDLRIALNRDDEYNNYYNNNYYNKDWVKFKILVKNNHKIYNADKSFYKDEIDSLFDIIWKDLGEMVKREMQLEQKSSNIKEHKDEN